MIPLKFLDKESRSLNQLFTRPESLSSHFPYAEVLSDDKIFVQKDGSLGVVYQVSMLEHEVMTEPQIIESVSSMKSWFQLPENAVLQVIYDQTRISPRDKRFEEWRNTYHESPLPSLLFEKRLDVIRSNEVSGIQPMDRRVLVTIRWFPKSKGSVPITNLFGDPNQTLDLVAKVASSDVHEFRDLARSFESSSALKLRRMSGDDLLLVLRRFFNPVTYFEREFLPYNPNVDFSDQIVYASPVLDFEGIEREGLKSRTLSLKTSPSFAYPGGMAYFTSLKFPFKIALNISFPSKAKVKKFFDIKEFFLENTPSARARRQKEEILSVQEKLAREDRCLHVSFHVTIEAETDEELGAMTREILSIFQEKLSCEVITEKDIGSALALNSLPLFYSPETDLSTRRYVRILRSDLVNFLPVFNSFTGLEDPVQLYVSREGNPVKFSLFENETSNHTVVLADSGSGKSSFVIDCVQAAKRLSPEPLVFVIDKKSSYLMLSEYFDADLTVFGHGKDAPFSPFRGVYDEEKINFLTQLIATGIKLMSPSYPVESDHVAVLSKAIRLAHNRKSKEVGLRLEDGELIRHDGACDVTLRMEDVVSEMATLTSLEEFEKSGDLIDTLVQKLSPFYGDGIYARYFNSGREGSGSSSKLFYIYDLDALDGDPVLQSLMTMSVVEEIRQKIREHADEGRTGIVVLEELQMLGKGSSVGKKFVMDAAETFRKLGVWLISLTPRPQNYFETDVGQAMWGVADNFIFLQMSSDNVDYVAQRSSLLDEAGIEIVKSLKTVRGSHADVFYTNKKRTRSGAFRFFQTPLDRWLAPTNAKSALEARKALKRHPDDKWRALEELSAKYPEGLM